MKSTLSNKILAASLIGAPLLMLLGDLAALLLDAGRGFWFTTTLLWFSFYAFTGAIVALVKLSGSSRLAVTGGLIALLGALMGATIMGLVRVEWAMEEGGLTQEQIIAAINHPAVFFSSRFPGIAFPLGLLVLTYALYSAGRLSLRSTLVLAAGIVLFPVGRIAVGPWANVPGDALMLIVLGRLGLDAFRAFESVPEERLMGV